MRIHLFILVFIVCGNFVHSQNSVANKRNVGNYVGGMDLNDFAIRSGFNTSEILGKSVSNEIVSNGNKNHGSTLLFEGWNNNGTIVLGEKNYLINNLNYDINKDVILAKFNKDSTFVFDFNNIDKVIIDNKSFKQFYNTKLNENKIYEVIFENDNFSLLKDHFVTVIEGSPDPMMNRPNNIIKKNSAYYILKNNTFEPFKWNKKFIIGLVDEDKKEEFEKYVKKNGLSYKDELDVGKVLRYFLKD